MSLSTATVTMNLSDMLGTDFDTRRTKVWVSTNVPSDTVIDTVGNAIRLGTGTATLNTDGTASVAVWKPGTGSNPASWQTYIHVDYPDAGTRTRVVRDFGPFTITADADLADLVAEQEVPPEYASALISELQGYVDQAQAIIDSGGGGGGGTVTPDASTTVKGKVELATNTETVTGTDTVRATTPAGVAAALAALPPAGLTAPVARGSLATDVQNSLAKADASVFRGGELETLPVVEGSDVLAPAGVYAADSIGGSDGDAIAAWANSSGSLGSLVQATGANKPILKKAQVNGHDVVRFGGGNRWMSVGSAALSTNFTLVVVGKPTNQNNFNCVIGDHLKSYVGRICAPSENANQSATVSYPGWAIYRVTVIDGKFVLYRNGQPVSSGNASNISTLYVGQDGGANFFCDWDIAEIQVLSGILTPEDGTSIDTMLGRKYGLRVGSGATSVRSRTNTTDAGGENIVLSLPEGRVDGQPLPLCLVAHGADGTQDSAYGYGSGPGTFTDAALALGCAVLSSNMHGNQWGNAQTQTDLLAAVTKAKTLWAAGFSKLILVGQSMGGLATMTAIRKNTLGPAGIPVVGALLIYPVIDMWTFRDLDDSAFVSAYSLTSSTLAASATAGATSISLNASYPAGTKLQLEAAVSSREYVTVTGTPTGSGPYATPVTALTKNHANGTKVSDSGTKVYDAGFNPIDAAASAFGNKRYRFYHSTTDGSVDKVTNTDAMVTKLLSGPAREASLVPTRGLHGDQSNYDGRDQAQFLLRCLNDPIIT